MAKTLGVGMEEMTFIDLRKGILYQRQRGAQVALIVV